MSTIMDESGQPLQKSGEKLAWWKRHFEKVLNVQSVVAESVVEELEDHSEAETTQVTREKVETTITRKRELVPRSFFGKAESAHDQNGGLATRD